MNLRTTLLLATLSFSTLTQASDLFATYEVPAGEQTELNTSNRFRITQLSLNKTETGETSLQYLLPLELTGVPNVIEFKGQLQADGQTELNYDKNKMQCSEDQISMTCNVQFGALTLDQKLATQKMIEKFGQTDLQKRLQVLGKFSTDPIGIIRIYKRPILSVKK